MSYSAASVYSNRFLWASVALALITAITLTVHRSGGGWYVLAFIMMPDVAGLTGISTTLAKGQMHPRAVPLYNALHRFVAPVLLGVLAFVEVIPSVWLVAALTWSLHIAIDRAVGYGLRTREGYQRD